MPSRVGCEYLVRIATDKYPAEIFFQCISVFFEVPMAVRLSSGSRRHQHPPELRPTAARTLESVFGILDGEIEGRRVLDLFSGVGSYGVMALRRGAVLSVFVDKSHEAEKRTLRALVQYHLESLGLMFREEVGVFLHKSDRWAQPFDVIFADPPYQEVTPLRLIEEILDSDLLAHGGILVFEHSRHNAPPEVPGLALRRSRVFGETTVSIWDHP
jgi:16S rRNA (guanine966-N2)-methyltransferase